MPGVHKTLELLFQEYFFNATSFFDSFLPETVKREMMMNCKFIARKLYIRLPTTSYEETMEIKRLMDFFEVTDQLKLISYYSYCAINSVFTIVFHRPSSLYSELLNNPHLRLCK